jgi:hypothetical protein
LVSKYMSTTIGASPKRSTTRTKMMIKNAVSS